MQLARFLIVFVLGVCTFLDSDCVSARDNEFANNFFEFYSDKIAGLDGRFGSVEFEYNRIVKHPNGFVQNEVFVGASRGVSYRVELADKKKRDIWGSCEDYIFRVVGNESNWTLRMAQSMDHRHVDSVPRSLHLVLASVGHTEAGFLYKNILRQKNVKVTNFSKSNLDGTNVAILEFEFENPTELGNTTRYSKIVFSEEDGTVIEVVLDSAEKDLTKITYAPTGGINKIQHVVDNNPYVTIEFERYESVDSANGFVLSDYGLPEPIFQVKPNMKSNNLFYWLLFGSVALFFFAFFFSKRKSSS